MTEDTISLKDTIPKKDFEDLEKLVKSSLLNPVEKDRKLAIVAVKEYNSFIKKVSVVDNQIFLTTKPEGAHTIGNSLGLSICCAGCSLFGSLGKIGS